MRSPKPHTPARLPRLRGWGKLGAVNKGRTIMADPGRGVHDMGGLPAGPVDRAEHDHVLWEKRVDALMMLLGGQKRGIIKVDELRRGIEQLGPGAYDNMSYYERWIASITNTLLAKGVVTSDELGRKMAEVAAREAKANDGASQ